MTDSATPADTDTASEDRVRMVVDPDSCIGAGQCEMLAPTTFLVDDDAGVASVLEDDLLSRNSAIEVADRCPGGAITFVEIDPPEQSEA